MLSRCDLHRSSGQRFQVGIDLLEMKFIEKKLLTICTLKSVKAFR